MALLCKPGGNASEAEIELHIENPFGQVAALLHLIRHEILVNKLAS